MPYGETKVYFDGSHYIAIPHTTRPNLRRTKSIGETIDIAMSEEGVEILNTPSFSQNDENEICDNNAENIDAGEF